MHTSARLDYLHCSKTTRLTSRTAVYGPVRTVVWQGSARDCRPYADQTPFPTETPDHGPDPGICAGIPNSRGPSETVTCSENLARLWMSA